MGAAFEHMGIETPALRLRCDNVIPHGRGLGSSSAAIVAGVCAARGLVAGGSLLMDDDAVFALAADLEGHPGQRGARLLRRLHRGLCRRWPLPRHLGRGGPPGLGGGVRPARRRRDQGGARPAPRHRDPRRRRRQRRPRRAARRGDREPPGSSCRPPRTGCTRLSGSRRCRARSRWSASCGTRLPAVVSGAGPTVLVLTDATARDAVAAHVPDGWQVLALDVELGGAEVVLG